MSHIPLEASRLREFFAPKTLAVVGANEGNGFVRNLVHSSHSPEVTFINRSGREIYGQQSLTDISELERGVDLAVISVPAQGVLDTVRQGNDLGIRNFIIHSAGFVESGPEGVERQQELVSFSQENDIVFLGPNCLGFANYVNGIPLHGASLPTELVTGRVGVVAQSGSASIVLMNSAREFEFSHVITTGNEARLTSEDALQFLLEDEHTDVILMFVEALREGKRFLELAHQAAMAGKPIVALKVGRSSAGKRVAMSHTGAIAGEDGAYTAALSAAGVIQVNDFDELIQTANVLAHYGKNPITKPAILGISGGELGLGADVASDVLLDLPDFTDQTRNELAELLGLTQAESIANPFDLGNGYSPKNFRETFKKLFATIENDPNVDGLVLLQDAQDSLLEGYAAFYRTVTDIFAEHVEESGQPAVHISILTEPLNQEIIAPFKDSGVLSLSGLRNGLQAVRNAAQFKLSQGNIRPQRPDEQTRHKLDGISATLTEGLAERIAASEYVPEIEAMGLLEEVGIPVVPEQTAVTAGDAAKAARNLGFPVVVKVWSDTVVHKAAAGGVALGLQNAEEVKQAFHQVTTSVEEKHPGSVWGVVVAPQVEGVAEAILGAIHDPNFGSFVLLGLGGSFVEQLGQTKLFLPPRTLAQAEEIIHQSPLAPVLEHIGVSASALAPTVLNFGLVTAASEGILSEFEINPLIISGDGQHWAVDARMKCQ